MNTALFLLAYFKIALLYLYRDWNLALFIVITLLLKPLSLTARKWGLLTLSLFWLFLKVPGFYIAVFFAAATVIYFICYALQFSPNKKRWSLTFATLLCALYFTLLNLSPSLHPVLGNGVHQLGIAYSLFRILALVLDVGRGLTIEANPLHFWMLQFFSPTFFHGPIERYQEFKQKIELPLPVDKKVVEQNLLRLGGAFFKMYLVQNTMMLPWQEYWDTPQHFSYLQLVWAFYARAFSFYLMVSAANDMAIACCRMIGIKLNENYHYPYFRRNLAEFWANWHMSVTRFLRDYLYIPLGGNRHHLYRNTLIVLLVIGLWHDTTWAFLIWGLWHGLGLIVFRKWKKFWERVEKNEKTNLLSTIQKTARNYPKLSSGISILLTFHYVAASWLILWGGHPQGLNFIVRLISVNHWKLFLWNS